MTTVFAGVVAVGLLLAVGYAGFLAGREHAERRAGVTIANLRRQRSAVIAQRDRAQEQASRYARILGTLPPVKVSEPAWMRDE